jgi:hypothetical protein
MFQHTVGESAYWICGHGLSPSHFVLQVPGSLGKWQEAAYSARHVGADGKVLSRGDF